MESRNRSSTWHRGLLCFALVTTLTLPAFGGTLSLTKCSVKAGKAAGEDSLSFSGVLDATQNDLQTAAPAEIVVTIDAASMPAALAFVFPITNSSYKKGKFNHSRTVNASKRSLKFDTRNGKISFSIKKVDLTGLACPITVTVTVGSSYTATLQVNEDIVNGTKKPCPPQLLMGVQDSLTVAKAKVKLGKSPGTDSLSLQGLFTISGTNYSKSNPLVIVVGSQTLTVPGNQIAAKGATEACSKVQSNEGPDVSAKFDFAKGTYSIAIKNMTVTGSGLVDFGINLFGFTLLSATQIDLGPTISYGLETLRRYDERGAWWDYASVYTIKGGDLDDAGQGPSTVEVEPASRWIDGHACSVVTTSGDGINMSMCWYSDAQGTYLAGWESSMGSGTFDSEIDSLKVAPTVMRVGQSQKGKGTFVGTYDIDDPGIDISNLQGKASSTLKLAGREQVQLSTNLPGPYTAVKVEQEIDLQGTMHLVYDDGQQSYNGPANFSAVVDQTWWCVPGIGIVKAITKMTIKISVNSFASTSIKINQTDELTAYGG